MVIWETNINTLIVSLSKTVIYTEPHYHIIQMSLLNVIIGIKISPMYVMATFKQTYWFFYFTYIK